MWKLDDFIEIYKQRKKKQNRKQYAAQHLDKIELILPLDKKSNKEENERKKKKYMYNVLNLNNI